MPRRGRTPHDQVSDTVLALRAVARITGIAFLVAAGAIHAAQIRAHLDEWDVAGLFFVASAVGQVGLAIALSRGVNWQAGGVRALVRSFSTPPAKKLIFAVMAASLTLLLTWAFSRAFGIPFGPNAGMREPVGRPDALATAFELLALVAMLPLLGRASDRRTPWLPRRIHTATLVALLLSTAATTAVALQPITCDSALRGEPPNEVGNTNQAALNALLDHAGAGKHSPGKSKQQEQPAAHPTGVNRTPACH